MGKASYRKFVVYTHRQYKIGEIKWCLGFTREGKPWDVAECCFFAYNLPVINIIFVKNIHPPVITINRSYKPFPNGWFTIVLPTVEESCWSTHQLVTIPAWQVLPARRMACGQRLGYGRSEKMENWGTPSLGTSIWPPCDLPYIIYETF